MKVKKHEMNRKSGSQQRNFRSERSIENYTKPREGHYENGADRGNNQ